MHGCADVVLGLLLARDVSLEGWPILVKMLDITYAVIEAVWTLHKSSDRTFFAEARLKWTVT